MSDKPSSLPGNRGEVVHELGVENSGLIGVFENRADARASIRAAVREAKYVKILSNKGNEWIGADGMLMEPLLAEQEHTKIPVHILLLHPRALWLRRRAREKRYWNRSAEVAAAQFDEAHDDVLRAGKSLKEMCPPRFHRHDPSWRFMLTDKEIFLQTYNSGRQIEREKVLQFSVESPVWGSAERYFDYVYELDSAEREQISYLAKFNQKTIDHEASAGLVVTRQVGGTRQVLMLHEDNLFGLSKGGIKTGESLIVAARRELLEETGADFNDTDGDFVTSVLVGQPFEDEISVKVILFFHAHFPGMVATPGLKDHAVWIDAAGLQGAVPAYDYVPEVLRKIGFNPKWGVRSG